MIRRRKCEECYFLPSEAFPIRDLGELKNFLGIQVKRGSYGLHLAQTQYFGNLLKTYDMEHLRPTNTSMVANQSLHSDEEPIHNATDYRRIISSLQYMVLTRPDIQFAVNRLLRSWRLSDRYTKQRSSTSSGIFQELPGMELSFTGCLITILRHFATRIREAIRHGGGTLVSWASRHGKEQNRLFDLCWRYSGVLGFTETEHDG